MVKKILVRKPDLYGSDLSSRESTVEVAGIRKSFDYPLESLRGIAAVMVVIFHLTLNGFVVSSDYPLLGGWQYQAPAHLSVIVFFMLSGYVIGIANPKPIADKHACLSYLKKRVIRLYPIYFLAIGATLVVAALFHQFYRPVDVAGYLLFLQGIVVPVPGYNGPIWSLSYEIAYYLLFLLVSAQQWRVEWLIALFVVLALAITKLLIGPLIVASYLYGAVFWLAGLLLARQPKEDKPLQYGTMLAFLLLLLSFDRMNLLRSILQGMHLDVSQQAAPNFYDRAIVFSDLSSLLICIPLLACFTNRSVIYRRWLELGAFILPGLYVITYVVSGKMWQSNLFATLIINLLIYVLAIAGYIFRFRMQRFGAKALQSTLGIGYVSYGLYIIHYPLLCLFNGFPAFSSSAMTSALKLVAYGGTLAVLAWWLERRFQPWIKQRLTSWL